MNANRIREHSPVVYPAAARGKALPKFYYLEHFLTLINSIHERYSDLLNPDELRFYQVFMACEFEAQALYVRLLMRKGEYFRAGKLNYPELGSIERAIDNLCHSGLLAIPVVCSLDDLYALFTRTEWLKILGMKSIQGSKPEIFLRVVELTNGNVKPLDVFGERILQIKRGEQFALYRRLYFGNDRQNLADFVLNDLGLFLYELYPMDRKTRLFSTREQIDTLQNYYALVERLENAEVLDEKYLDDILELIPIVAAAKAIDSYAERALSRRIQKLEIRIARQFERLKCYEKALNIYSRVSLAPAMERRIRILKTLKRHSEAERLCRDLISNGTEAERLFANAFLPGIEKKSGKFRRQPSVFTEVKQTLELPLVNSASVENQAMSYFRAYGECYYVENHLFSGVFGLLFWPAIFADVPGAFSHAFQNAPHDLYQEDFIVNREHLIEQAWSRLSSWCLNSDLALTCYELHKGKACVFVNWNILTRDLLTLALQRISLKDWQRIFERLWQDLRENSSGFPDLIYFPREGGYHLLEVKGPGDRLQANQKRWLQYFEEHGLPYKVVYVEWQ